MNAALFYRIASVLLVLFTAAHSVGFRRVDPRWGVEAPIATLKATRFEVQGVTRTYWGFYTGFGLFVSVLLLFAAILAWQLGGMPRDVLASLSVLRWGFVLCFAAVTYLSWRYFFPAPVISSSLITVCLAAAAWVASRP